MHIDFYNLGFDTPRATFYLWSPWRSSALEHRLFEVVGSLLGGKPEQDADEWRLHVTDAKPFHIALQSVCRVMKGWQEEADAGQEKRSWRWLFEGDVDDQGYDHQGERSCLWAYLRLSIDRNGVGEADKGEDIDLNGFGIRIWPNGS